MATFKFAPCQTLCVRPVKTSKLKWIKAALAAETHDLKSVEAVDDLEPGNKCAFMQ